ncbi:hypothetical protein V6N13_083610 [Hibiscus sabdariffa]|uniref:Uncharacterized protein n=1 Tax=Hibiscus sabdariffa TaxID=183260 RepID=A0ABR2SYK9_9ROSI
MSTAPDLLDCYLENAESPITPPLGTTNGRPPDGKQLASVESSSASGHLYDLINTVVLHGKWNARTWKYLSWMSKPGLMMFDLI